MHILQTRSQISHAGHCYLTDETSIAINIVLSAKFVTVGQKLPYTCYAYGILYLSESVEIFVQKNIRVFQSFHDSDPQHSLQYVSIISLFSVMSIDQRVVVVAWCNQWLSQNKVENLNLAHGEIYSIQFYSLILFYCK